MLRGDDWVPRLVRDQQKQLKRAHTKLQACFGRPATEDEIAAEMGIARKNWINSCRVSAAQISSRWMTCGLAASSGSAIFCRPMVPASSDSVALRERKQALAAAIDRLPDRERTVVALYYHEGLTFKEIGKVLTVSGIAGIPTPWSGDYATAQSPARRAGTVSLRDRSGAGFAQALVECNVWYHRQGDILPARSLVMPGTRRGHPLRFLVHASRQSGGNSRIAAIANAAPTHLVAGEAAPRRSPTKSRMVWASWSVMAARPVEIEFLGPHRRRGAGGWRGTKATRRPRHPCRQGRRLR